VHTAAWCDFGRSSQLWVVTKPVKGGALTRFDGFKRDDYGRVSKHCENAYATPLERKELSAQGRSWGGLRVKGESG
jgi:hypothetical protein